MRRSDIAIILLLLVVVAFLLVQLTPIPAGDDLAEGIVDFTVDAAESTANSLEGFLNRLITTPQSDIARVLLIAGGVVLLLAGWRVYDFIVIIAGFIIGASVAVALVSADNTFLVIAALLLGDMLGAVLSVFVYYVAVFLIGVYIGIALTNALLTALSLTPISPFVLLIGGIIGGMVLLALSFEFLALMSSLVGAQMLTLGLGLPVLWTVIFAIVGVAVQFGFMQALHYDFRRRPRYYNPLRRALD